MASHKATRGLDLAEPRPSSALGGVRAVQLVAGEAGAQDAEAIFYRQMANRSAQLAIGCSAPSVAQALLALGLEYMALAAPLRRRRNDGTRGMHSPPAAT